MCMHIRVHAEHGHSHAGVLGW